MATKKQKRNRIILVISLAVIALLAFTQLDILGVGTTPSTLLTLSVDDLDIISNEDDIDDSFYRIVANVGQGGESVIGTLEGEVTQSQLNQPLPDRFQTDNELDFRANIEDEEAIYPLNPQQGQNAEFLFFSTSLLEKQLFESHEDCPQDIVVADFERPRRKYCIGYEKSGRFADVSSPNIKTTVGYELTRPESTVSGEISNFGANSGLKEIRENGDLVGRIRIAQSSQRAGSNPPTESNFKGYFDEASGWKLLRQSTVQSYKNARDSALQETLTSSFIDDIESTNGCRNFLFLDKNCLRTKLQNKISGVQSQQQQVVGGSGDFDDGAMSFDNKNDESSGKIVYSPENPDLTNTQISLDVKASWIGVKSIVTAPEITSGISCSDFEQNGQIDVPVRNTGQQGSSFNVKLNSCGAFTQLSEVSQRFIPGGDTRQFSIDIQGDGEGHSESCEVEAFNVEFPSENNVETVSCQSTSVDECSAGQERLTVDNGEDCVLQCSNGDYGTEPAFCCESGITSFVNDDGQVNYECSEGNTTDVVRNIYYRYDSSSDDCDSVLLSPSEVTTNDYEDLDLCEEQITGGNGDNGTEDGFSLSDIGIVTWIIVAAILAGIILIIIGVVTKEKEPIKVGKRRLMK